MRVLSFSLLVTVGCLFASSTEGSKLPVPNHYISPSFDAPSVVESFARSSPVLETVQGQPLVEAFEPVQSNALSSEFVERQRSQSQAAADPLWPDFKADDGGPSVSRGRTLQFNHQLSSSDGTRNLAFPGFNTNSRDAGINNFKFLPQGEVLSRGFSHDTRHNVGAHAFGTGASHSGGSRSGTEVGGFSGNNFRAGVSTFGEGNREQSFRSSGGSSQFSPAAGQDAQEIFGSFGGSSSGFPEGFTPGEKFIPPKFDPEQNNIERSESQFLTGFDANAAAGINKEDCIRNTVTIRSTSLSIVPIATNIVSTVLVTNTLSGTRTEIATIQSTRIHTNTVRRTQISTVYSTVERFSTQTKLVPANTHTSTFTSLVTEFIDRTSLTTITDTVVSRTTAFVTVTNSRASTTTVSIPLYTTDFVQLPAVVRSFVIEQTRTVSLDNTLPPQILYVSETVYKTETLTATQTLQPETIIRTKTVVVPSYSTIYTTSVGTRTKTLRSTIPTILTKTATTYSSVFRLGVAVNTQFSTITETVTEAQYFTTTVPSYVTVSVTNDIPAITTRVSTHYAGVQRTVTVPGGVVTSYSTFTTFVSVYKTVTNTLTTPIVYATQTVTQNCPAGQPFK
ncbi:mucin-5AC-like isoform X1 [Hyalella azteca]|uniref:Mucin-5AC-like isoform X1 n=1 Tax=Hyalella azteca TaxID=294128 RepID=A0A979FQG2_HYAAZ|nr:mucin-5AC-like isoform X1 [Hyalella azteca]XP_047738672.1 mucin-5AC-like isoform X1 [Hyalella azteca]